MLLNDSFLTMLTGFLTGFLHMNEQKAEWKDNYWQSLYSIILDTKSNYCHVF